MAIADVQRASGLVYGIQYTCRRHVSTSACIRTHFSIHFYVYCMMQYRVAKLPLEVMIFCLSCRDRVILRSGGRHTSGRNLFVTLDVAICCFRVESWPFGPRGFRPRHDEKRFFHRFVSRNWDRSCIHRFNLHGLSCFALDLFCVAFLITFLFLF